MNVTSLELSQTLFDLSGWVMQPNTSPAYIDGKLWTPGMGSLIHDGSDWFPAYDLGYLLRKLPSATTITKYSDLYEAITTGCAGATDDSSPDDAAASLAITLLKQGILKRSSSE